MKNKKIFYTVFTVTILNVLLFSFSVYALSGWLVKVNNTEVLSIGEFENEFNSFIDFQALNQPTGVFASKKEIDKAKKDKKNKKIYLKNVINDILIVQDAKKKRIYDEDKLKKKGKVLAHLIQRVLIKQIYIQKVISKKTKKPKQEIVEAIYNEITKRDKNKTLSAGKKMEIARKQAKMQAMQQTYISTVDQLRSKSRIKTSDKYMDYLSE